MEQYKIKGQAKKAKNLDENSIPVDTKRNIEDGDIMMVAKTNYELQTKDKSKIEAYYDENTEIAYNNRLDIENATTGFGDEAFRMRAVAVAVKESRGNDFKITGVSTDPLINNYTGDKGQIENAQQSIFNLSNSKNIHYHMDKPLKEILPEMEIIQKAGNKDLNDQMRKRIEEATKYFYTILEDMFLNKDSDANKKIKNQAQEILDTSISKGIRESRQMTSNINDAKKEIEKEQPEENRGIHYAKSTENVQPSEFITNSVNTSVTEGQNLSNTTIVESKASTHTQQVRSVENDNNSDRPNITYSTNEQKKTKETIIEQKQGRRRTTITEAEGQAQINVNNRSTESNVETIDPNTNISESENQIYEQGPFLEDSSSRGQRRRRKPSIRVEDTKESSEKTRQVIGRNAGPIRTYTDNTGVEHPQFEDYYGNKKTDNSFKRNNNRSA